MNLECGAKTHRLCKTLGCVLIKELPACALWNLRIPVRSVTPVCLSFLHTLKWTDYPDGDKPVPPLCSGNRGE